MRGNAEGLGRSRTTHDALGVQLRGERAARVLGCQHHPVECSGVKIAAGSLVFGELPGRLNLDSWYFEGLEAGLGEQFAQFRVLVARARVEHDGRAHAYTTW